MELHRSVDTVGVGAYATPVVATMPPAVPPMLRTPMAPQRWGRVGPFSWMLRRLFGLDPRLPDIEGPAAGAVAAEFRTALRIALPALYATMCGGDLPNS